MAITDLTNLTSMILISNKDMDVNDALDIATARRKKIVNDDTAEIDEKELEHFLNKYEGRRN